LQSSTAAFNATKRNITRYPDINNKLNPYDEGCLYSYGLQDVQRTCNSEDTDVTKCSNNDLNYMEIRIHTGDWESITYESWIIQILLSEILHVPTTVDSGFGNEESLNFYNSRGEYSYGRYTLYDSLSTAYNSKDGDCVPIIQGEKLRNPNVTCAHVIPESWRGTFASIVVLNRFELPFKFRSVVLDQCQKRGELTDSSFLWFLCYLFPISLPKL
jgi:hypothetical protein